MYDTWQFIKTDTLFLANFLQIFKTKFSVQALAKYERNWTFYGLKSKFARLQ